MKKAVFISLFLIVLSLSGLAQTSQTGREVNARSFGAKCDGTTNDQSAIQTAITAMATAGGVVNLPDGTCVVTGLSVPGGVILRGKGKSTTFIKSSTNAVILDLVQGAGTYLFRGPTVQQLTVEGSSSGGSQIGINIDDPVYFLDVVVQDVAVTATGSHGVYFGKVFSSLFDNITAGSSNAGYPFLFNQINMPGNTFRNLYAADVNSTSPAGFRVRTGNITCWGCNGINNSSANSWWAIVGDKVGTDGALTNRSAYFTCNDCNIESSKAGGILHYYNSTSRLDGRTEFTGDASGSGTYIALKYEIDTAGGLIPSDFPKGSLGPLVVFTNSPLAYYANSEVIHANDLPPVTVAGQVRQADGVIITSYRNTTNSRSEKVYRTDAAKPVVTITSSTSFTEPGATNYEANCAAPCTLTLPWPGFWNSNEQLIYIRNIGAGALTLAANSGGSFNGGAGPTLAQNESILYLPHTASADYRQVSLAGGGAANRLAYYAGLQNLTSSANLTYDGTTVLNQRAGGNPFFAANDTTNGITTRFGPLAGAPDRAIVGTTSNHPFGLYANNAERWTVGTAGHFTPGAANTTDVGSSSLPGRTGYFGTSLITGIGSSVTGQIVLNNSSNTNTTTLQSGAPASSITFTLPATLPASAGCLQVNSSGVISQTGSACGSGGGGSTVWSSLTDPTGNLALSMGANTTSLTWGNSTSTANLFTLADGASNTGTGYIFSVNTASGSAAKPIRITAGGTAVGVEMTTAGVLQAINSGEIRATTANPSATIGLTANNGSATSAMRSDATPALSQSIAPTWTALHTFNPGTTPTTAALIDINSLGSAGTRDSNWLMMRGRSNDGSTHLTEWKQFVDVNTNAGGSLWSLESRIDAASFAVRFTVSDAGAVSGGAFSGDSFTASGGSILDDDINAVTGFTLAGAAPSGQYLRGNGTRAVFSAIQNGDLDADLTAFANNSTNGFWARTGAGAGAARTITGTANKITVTNGDGVSGAPTITLPSLLIIDDVELSNGSAVATGTTAGNTINLSAYDTDGTTYIDLVRLTAGTTPTLRLTLGSDATGDIFYRDSSGNVARLPIGSTGQVLTVASGLPSWAAAGGGSSPPFADTQTIVKGSVDATKLIRFEVDGLTTGTTRVITTPDTDGTLVYESNTATLTNKTIDSANNLITLPISDLAASDSNATFAQTSFNTTFTHTTGLMAASWSGNTTTSNAFALSHSNTTATGNLLNLSTSASVSVRPLAISPQGTQSFLADHLGNVVIASAALATTATNGFLYITSTAGTPTGTPTSYTGRVPINYDSTNNKLYINEAGTWVDVTGGGGGGLGDPGANGIVARTALNTTTARTITAGSSNGLSITDGNGVSGNPTVDFATTNTAGLGFSLPGNGGLPFVTDSSNALAGSANEVRVALFYAPGRITVDRVGLNGVVDSASQNAGVGIYSADGNTKICDSGAISTTSWAGAANYALSASCTFGPGYFYFAWTASSTTPTVRSGAAITNFFAPLNNGTGTVLGTAANASSGGVLPSTLGTLTDSNGLAIPIVRFYKN